MQADKPAFWPRCLGLLPLLLMLLGMARPACARLGDEAEAVLVLHSYYPDYIWTQQLNKGIGDILNARPNLELYYEYLDSRRRTEEDQVGNYHRFLLSKYSVVPLKAIIACDNAALAFLLKYPDLLPEVPLVFCGINNFQHEMLPENRPVTGTAEMVRIRETVDLILSQHADCKRIVLLSDHYALTARLTMEEAGRQLADLEADVEIEQVPDLPFSATLQWIRQLPRDTVLLMLLYTRDRDGRNLPVLFAMDRIREVSPVPIYSVWDFYLGHGITGGVLLSGYDTGRDAGRRALNLLLGRDTKSMPIDTLEASHLSFDWRVVQEQHLPTHLLPPQAHFEGRPRSLAERLGIWYYILLGVLALETLLITALISMIFQRRRTMASLQMRQFIVDQSDFPILVVDQYGRIQFLNHCACRVLGYLREQLIDKHISLVSPERDFSPSQFAQTWQEIISHSEVGRTTYLRNRQGRDLRYRLRLTPLQSGTMTLCSITAIDQRDLQHQLEVLQNALKHAEIGILLCHKNGSIFYVNDYCCRLVGREREELLHQKVKQLDPRISEAWIERQWKNLRHQGVLRMQLKRRAAASKEQNREIWLDLTINYVHMEEAEFACIFLRDDTVRKEGEQRLKELVIRRNRIQELARSGDFSFDASHEAVEFSAMAATLFGFAEGAGRYPLREVLKRIHPADLEILQQQTQGKVDALFELPAFRVFRAQQGEVHLRARGHICRNPDGSIRLAEGSVQDFSDQVLAEQELRQHHDFLVSLVQHMPLGVSVKDLRRDLAYTIWNEEMERITGQSAGDVLGQRDTDLHAVELSERMRREDLRLLELGQMQTESTHSLPTESGLRIVRRTRIPLLDAQGVPTALITLLQDVSEHVTRERGERSKEKMRALEQLAGGVSHNGGEQFKAILGYATLLEEELTDSRMRDYASAIARAAQQGTSFIRQLQAFALDTRRMDVRVDMHQLLHDTLRTFTEELRAGIVVQQFLKAEDARVQGDPDQLQLVLLNLLKNAEEAISKTGRVTLSSECVLMDSSDTQHMLDEDMEAGRYFKLSVTDTGSGIAPAVRAMIFEPFFTTRDTHKHLGLGLAAVSGWVEDHRGCLHVYSELEHGSTFSLYLPLSEQSVLDEHLPVIHHPGRVLLVDDEELARLTYSRMLSRLGYEVEAFDDPQQALEVYQANAEQFCLVVLDMVMPTLSGRECFERIKAQRANQPVLLISGFTLDAEMREMLCHGLDGYLQKPITGEILSRKVASILGDRSQTES